MNKIEYSKLLGAQHANKSKVSTLQGTIAANTSKIQQAATDKLAAVRQKDQASANTAQFTIESLQQENADLNEKIEKIKSMRPTKAQTDTAWKADLIENPEYLTEMVIFKTAAALYDAMCTRAKREEREWHDFAVALSNMLPNDGFHLEYTEYEPSPAYALKISGYDQASEALFHDPNGDSITFDPAGIDGLIELLQKIKTTGVDSIL